VSHGGHPASCFKQTWKEPSNLSVIWWVTLDDGRPWTDLDSWYAHEADGPWKIKVNNLTTSSDVGNIQRESSTVLSRSPWESWNFKKVAHVVWFVALFVSSFVYSRGQWPRTPVGYISQLRVLVVKVLFFLYSRTLFYNVKRTVQWCTLSLHSFTARHFVLPVALAVFCNTFLKL
jgi:hypothetical protein